MMNIVITEEAIQDLRREGAGAADLQRLADMVAEHPRGRYPVDTFGGLVCYGVPLAWIRDHTMQRGTILTRREAAKLDARKDPTFYGLF